jgi:hypothetical protein
VLVKGRLCWSTDDKYCYNLADWYNYVELRLETGQTLSGVEFDDARSVEALEKISEKTFHSLRILQDVKNGQLWAWGLILQEDENTIGQYKRVGRHNAQLNTIYEGIEESVVTLV